jgi:DNA-directed RNA polymerase subunit omega
VSYPYTDPMSMITPRVDKLLAHTDTHYAAVCVAAKRARQINAYYHSLSEGAYGEYTPPMVEVPSGNYLTIALEETAAGKLKYEYKA